MGDGSGFTETPIDTFIQIGLNKEVVGSARIYTLDTNDKGTKEKLDALKKLLSDKRVSVEIGPGNQLDSLIFAGRYSKADVVIGIDPDFDYPEIKPPTDNANGIMPQIILLKGDIWNNRNITDFFNAYGDESQRIAIYSQLVSPDSFQIQKLINSTLPLSKKGSMVVLDSGALEELSAHHYDKTQIEAEMLAEKGLKNPSHLDWIKYQLRTMDQKEITSEEYNTGVKEGKYPPTFFLRAGKMIIFSHPVT